PVPFLDTRKPLFHLSIFFFFFCTCLIADFTGVLVIPQELEREVEREHPTTVAHQPLRSRYRSS
ncbi:unnamed protein product, partial [Linum tenue]